MNPTYVSKGAGGGRFDFDDGGTYCGGWEDGKAHGHGVCTGPKGQGEYSGAWHYGFEVSGVYTWPSGSTYEGQWQNGKRHGLGVETRGRWIYRGEWTNGFKGRYGVRQSITSGAKYDGTWANGLQDGYGSETYADGGTFQGQWMRGMRHGYGVRTSAPFGLAAHYKPRNIRASMSSLGSENVEGGGTDRDRRMDDCRGGFVLKAGVTDSLPRRRSLTDKSGTFRGNFLKGLKGKKQRSAGDVDPKGTVWSVRSTGSNLSSASSESTHSGTTHESGHTDSSFVSQDEITDTNVIENYMGEWKNDKRCGFGIAERSDGLKYEGEWYNNKKFGYGVTTFKDGTREEGKYKNNILVTSGKKKHLFLLRSAKFRERVQAAVNAAIRASQIALQKADIAISRTATARGKAEQADISALNAREDTDIARLVAKQHAPEFHQPGTDILKRKLDSSRDSNEFRRLQYRESSPHFRSKSLYVQGGNKDTLSVSRDNLLYPPSNGEVEGVYFAPEVSNPPSQSALLDVFRNNPDRRPSAAAFLRRPSAFGNIRRPSTFVEVKVAPGHAEHYSEQYRHNPTSYHRAFPEYTIQQVVDDHFGHYYEKVKRAEKKKPKRFVDNPHFNHQASGFPPLSHYYGAAAADATPDSGVSESMDNEETSPTRPPRRSTLPNVLYPENVQLNFNPTDSEEGEEDPLLLRNFGGGGGGDGVVRTGSLNHVPASRRPHALAKMNSVAGTRKKSLPDITSLGQEGKIITRETIAVLSSQRREAIRKEEEEAERLRANPLLYLVSPDMRDWLSSHQLLILLLFINISLAIMFFKLLS